MIGKMTDAIQEEIYTRVHNALHPRHEALNCRTFYGIDLDDVLGALGVEKISDLVEENPDKAKNIQTAKANAVANPEPTRKELAVAAVKSGESYNSVAKQIGVSYNTIVTW